MSAESGARQRFAPCGGGGRTRVGEAGTRARRLARGASAHWASARDGDSALDERALGERARGESACARETIAREPGTWLELWSACLGKTREELLMQTRAAAEGMEASELLAAQMMALRDAHMTRLPHRSSFRVPMRRWMWCIWTWSGCDCLDLPVGTLMMLGWG